MIRKLIAVFSKSVSERRAAPRYDFEAPVKIWIEASGGGTGKLKMPVAESLFITGVTKDFSRSGIAFIVPSIRIRERYLVGESCALSVEINLPDGKLQMQVIGLRYEQIGEHLSVSRYLIGASIDRMSEENRESYEYFLRHGRKGKLKTVSLAVEAVQEVREAAEIA